MRWAALFDDLQAQSVALERAQRFAEVADRARSEIGALALADRLRAALDLPLRFRLRGGLVLAGRLRRCGPDWLLIAEAGAGADREAVVRMSAVESVRGLPRFSTGSGAVGRVESRLGLRQVLRGIARDRSAVQVHLTDGSTSDGMLDRVGADFVDLAAHPGAEVRRQRDLVDLFTIAVNAIAAVRRSV